MKLELQAPRSLLLEFWLISILKMIKFYQLFITIQLIFMERHFRELIVIKRRIAVYYFSWCVIMQTLLKVIKYWNICTLNIDVLFKRVCVSLAWWRHRWIVAFHSFIRPVIRSHFLFDFTRPDKSDDQLARHKMWNINTCNIFYWRAGDSNLQVSKKRNHNKTTNKQQIDM